MATQCQPVWTSEAFSLGTSGKTEVVDAFFEGGGRDAYLDLAYDGSCYILHDDGERRHHEFDLHEFHLNLHSAARLRAEIAGVARFPK